MILRLILIATTLFLSAVLGLNLSATAPAWPQLLWPALVFALLWGRVPQGELVFWGGLSGMLLDLSSGDVPGMRTLGLATLAWGATSFGHEKRNRIASRLFARLTILLLAMAIDVLAAWAGHVDGALPDPGTLTNTFICAALVLVPCSLLLETVFASDATDRPWETFRL